MAEVVRAQVDYWPDTESSNDDLPNHITGRAYDYWHCVGVAVSGAG